MSHWNKQYLSAAICLSSAKAFTSNSFLRINEAYKLCYTLKER